MSMQLDTRLIHILTTISSIILALSLFTGCTSTRLIEVKQSPISTANSSPKNMSPTVTSSTNVVGTSLEGRDIQCLTIGDGRETVLFIAGIHGDEAAGVPLVNRLYQELTTSGSIKTHHRILIVPQANPDAVAHDRRTNMNGVDINRNFPADNHRSRARNGYEPLSEPESTALHDLILSSNPSLIVSIHQPIACVDYDGPALEIAKEISSHSGLPIHKLGSRPGSLGSWAGVDRGIAVITLELPATASRLSERELWKTYGPALLSVINK